VTRACAVVPPFHPELPEPQQRTVLISIHARFAELILLGAKTVELRRRFSIQAQGSRLLIYATYPTAAVVGSAIIERVEHLSTDDLWHQYGEAAAVSRSELDEYFHGRSAGCALILAAPRRFDRPISLEDMRGAHALRPPQSYLYLRAPHGSLLAYEQD
jgi:predicted transcriptional regulator